jgi:cytochrome c peroxidase
MPSATSTSPSTRSDSRRARAAGGGWLVMVLLAACACGSESAPAPNGGGDEQARLAALALPAAPVTPPDSTNRYADDPAAAALGQKLFFDPRFSGPLLDDDNDGGENSVGLLGETGKVSCASCHVPSSGSFFDTRSARGQLSLAAGWTHRRTPALLDVAQARLLGWDGRRTTAYSVVFAVIESPLEFNSSRLFVAQQLARAYRAEYEAVFGPLPALDAYAPLEAATAGCTAMPRDPTKETCPRPGQDDPDVTRVVVNMGKAIGAYMRRLTCGQSRFETWIRGDASALSAEEQAGARLFVGKAKCDTCHSGPYLTDQQFHNVGARGGLVDFTGVNNINDPGAVAGLAFAPGDALGPTGPFSDGDDGRLAAIPKDLGTLEGAFRTPTLRCMDRRPSFMHSAAYRSLTAVVDLFSEGGSGGFVGTSEIVALNLTTEEKNQLIAFMEALQGPGPDVALRTAPPLP